MGKTSDFKNKMIVENEKKIEILEDALFNYAHEGNWLQCDEESFNNIFSDNQNGYVIAKEAFKKINALEIEQQKEDGK